MFEAACGFDGQFLLLVPDDERGAVAIECWLVTRPMGFLAKIVRRVESWFALAGQIESYYTKAQTQVARLTRALLACVFRGAPVLQYPDDEPASELLNRIK
jgi:hypothetical protein